MFNSLLYIKFVVAFIMLLLIVMQLFDDVLLFVPMITNLISL
jgi:hypothetical protein